MFNIAIKELLKYKYIVIFLIIYIAYFFIFHPGETNCLVKRTIGIPCMACGMSRAFISLLSFNLKEAFHFHPLFFIVPFLVIVFLFQEIRFMGRLFHSKLFWSIILSLFKCCLKHCF